MMIYYILLTLLTALVLFRHMNRIMVSRNNISMIDAGSIEKPKSHFSFTSKARQYVQDARTLHHQLINATAIDMMVIIAWAVPALIGFFNHYKF